MLRSLDIAPSFPFYRLKKTISHPGVQIELSPSLGTVFYKIYLVGGLELTVNTATLASLNHPLLPSGNTIICRFVCDSM